MKLYGSCGPLNLVLSPNFTPPHNPPHCNTKEGTSTLGRESANPTRKPKAEPRKKKYGITVTKLSSPGWRDLFPRPLPSPHTYTFYVYRSLPPSSRCLLLCTSRCWSCLYVCPFMFLSGAFPLHKIISLDLQGGEPHIHETAEVGTVSIGTDPFLPL